VSLNYNPDLMNFCIHIVKVNSTHDKTQSIEKSLFRDISFRLWIGWGLNGSLE